MRKLYTLLFSVMTFSAFAQNYASQNVTLLGHFNDPSVQPEPAYGIRYQGVWGWKDTANGNEYGIIGATDGVYFINVTNPASPVQCDYVPGVHTACIWREIKTYKNYVYMVSDDGGVQPNSFMIADLSYLPDSVHVVHNGTSIFERCHTIYVDGQYLYGGSVTRSNNSYMSMAVYDLEPNPAYPDFLRALDQDYPIPSTVHDMFVRNDTVYASGGFDGLHIFKFNGQSPFQQLGTLTQYPEQGYNHSSFLTPDGNTLIFMDEVPSGLGVKALDVSNLQNLSVPTTNVFRSTAGCTPHNPYIMGANRLIAAYYQDGLQIFDISNPANVVRTGYFDTDTLNGVQNNYPDPYHGCWGAYTDLPSGNVLASDMQNGLYIFDVTNALSVPVPQPQLNSLSAYPNPFNHDFSVSIGLDKGQNVTYEVYDNSGRLVISEQVTLPPGNSLLEVKAEALAPGHYNVRVSGETLNGTVKLVKLQ